MPTLRLAAPLLLLLAARAPAQEPGVPVADGAHAARPSLRAVPLQGAIALDGRLDEAGWAAAPFTSDFTQVDPVEGAAPTERTEVRIVYDHDALYIGARMYDSGPVTSRLERRDSGMGTSDRLAISLDTYHDHVVAFRFEVNPDGVKNDALRSNVMDPSWDAVWEVATRVDSLGWTAEFRIPLNQMRFTAADEQTWGLQFSRMIARKQEHDVFAFTPKSERDGVARYGHLLGLRGLKPGRRLEVLPYATVRSEHRSVAAGNPYRDGSDQFEGVGLDAKYGLTSNLTLTATVNPDFGQVELDPAQINLSAYETYYEEKRPFFVEGNDIFGFGEGPELFYSRRIGAAPQLDVEDAAFADVPAASTILGAAKLTGKTASGWSLGVLDAVTSRESAPFVTEAGEPGSAVVEPLTHFFVGRARRDLNQGGTTLGGIVTAVNRRLSTPELAGALRHSAYVGGVDFRHEFAARRWVLSGSLTGSRIAGDAPVILAAQRSSARYFQRPDARRARLDSAATSLAGYSANLSLTRQAGVHWRGGLDLDAVSPGYEINDLGFRSSVDRLGADGFLRYVENRPGRVFRSWSLVSSARRSWNYDGDALGSSLSLSGNGQLLGYWGGGFTLQHGLAALDDRFTRGGPLVRFPASNSVNANIYSDSRRPLTLNANGNYWRDGVDSWRSGLGLTLGLKPAPNWNVSLGPALNRSHYNAQWVTRLDDTTAAHTLGARYLYARFDQTTLGVGTRLNVTFTPVLTLELYAQPYIASGDYYDLGELHAARTFQFDRYGAGTLARESDGAYRVDPDGAGGPAPAVTVDDPSFNYRSLRGSAVARWEFRPGSTLFLVWQQQRSDNLSVASLDDVRQGVGRFDLSRDARGLVGLRPENVFLVKVNYWINP